MPKRRRRAATRSITPSSTATAPAVSLINFALQRVRHRHLHREDRVMLHNRGTGFVVEPGSSEYDRGRQAADAHDHSGAPMRGGRCEMPVRRDGRGITSRLGHAQADHQHGSDYGMDVQAAIDHPRMFYRGEKTEVERGVPAATIAA
jgi:gamma-glutamyltranspeptidase/glutathione hydrolase